MPILILTAKDGEYDQADGLDLGVDDYLIKPFSFVVLAARLRALLRRGAVPRPVLLTADDLVLDPAATGSAGRRRRGADPARVLAAGIPDAPRRCYAVSKADILHHVWDANYDAVDANVVEVYVG